MTSRRVSRWRHRAPLGRGAHDGEAITWLAPVVHDGLQILYEVPTFTVLQRICGEYIVEHRFTLDADAGLTCACRRRLATYDEWVEHVAELQASHLAMAIQEARNTIGKP